MSTARSPHGTPRERAQAIVATLPLADRIRLLSGRDFWTTEAVEGVVPSVMLTDGPHGLRKQAGDADHVGLNDAVPATCFPVAATLACTWDPALLEEVGAALGREARAEDVAVLLGPGLNLKRHPRCGRNFEYFSEDPYLSGMLAAALVRGIQSEGVAACPKHYAANNQETARMVIDTIIDERTLRELYLRGFEIVVETSDPATLMTSYNQVNGQFASDNEHLLARRAARRVGLRRPGDVRLGRHQRPRRRPARRDGPRDARRVERVRRRHRRRRPRRATGRGRRGPICDACGGARPALAGAAGCHPGHGHGLRRPPRPGPTRGRRGHGPADQRRAAAPASGGHNRCHRGLRRGPALPGGGQLEGQPHPGRRDCSTRSPSRPAVGSRSATPPGTTRSPGTPPRP